LKLKSGKDKLATVFEKRRITGTASVCGDRV
jgi:hypothetical protein